MNARLDLRPLSESGGFIVDHTVFGLLVDLETRKAQRLGYWVSLIFLDADGAASTSEPDAEAVVRNIARSIRSTDVVARRDKSSVSMLLVGAETECLPTIFQRLTAGTEGTTWRAGGACYPATAASAHDLVDQATSMMTRAMRDGEPRLCLPS
jgi:hypothetical protein